MTELRCFMCQLLRVSSSAFKLKFAHARSIAGCERPGPWVDSLICHVLGLHFQMLIDLPRAWVALSHASGLRRSFWRDCFEPVHVFLHCPILKFQLMLLSEILLADAR